MGQLQALFSPLHRLSRRPIILPIPLRILHRPPQALDQDVIERSPPPGPTHLAPCGRSPPWKRQARKLCALGTLKDRRRGHPERVRQRRQADSHLHRDRPRPRPPRPAAPIQHRDQRDQAAMHAAL